MTNNEAAIAQRSREKIYFDHMDMDYYFSWILGREIYEGSDREECFSVAQSVPNGDASSWQAEWAKLAQRVDTEARTALDAGDREKARRAYLRACTYYRAPLFIMSPDDARFRMLHSQMQACFQAAASLFDPPVEAIQIPFQNKLLPGYFWRADEGEKQQPALIVIGGVETFAEDCFFMLGQAGRQRGYHVITADISGQGLNPDQGLYFEARMETPLKAVVDYCLARAEIDPERLALFGFSWGGHIVFKGAAHDQRIKALIANPAMPDVFRAAWAQQSGHDRRDPINKIAFSQIAWRFGLKISFNPGDIIRRFGKAYDYLAHGKANVSAVRCPTLCLAGEGEAQITLNIARECYAQLPHPLKKLVIFTKEQGGEAHCQVNNLALPNGVMFDWLDEVFQVRSN